MTAVVRRAGGERAYSRIRRQPDPLIRRIVSGCPPALAAQRAAALGFTADGGIDEVVQALLKTISPMQKGLV